MKNPAWVYPKIPIPLTRLDVDLVLLQAFLLNALLQLFIVRVLWTDEAVDLLVLAVHTQSSVHETKLFPHINCHLVVTFVKIFLYFQDVMFLVSVALRGLQVVFPLSSDFILIHPYSARTEERKIEVYLLKLVPDLRAKFLVHVPVLSLTDSAAVVGCVASSANLAVWSKAHLEKYGN